MEKDSDENIIQKTLVEKDGSFEFKDYIPEKSYFISAQSEGLSDIYEIYISGQQKNVLVNRTDKTVFSFKILPTQDVVLNESRVQETQLVSNRPQFLIDNVDIGLDLQDIYDFDIKLIEKRNFTSLNKALENGLLGKRVIIRAFDAVDSESSEIQLTTLSSKDIQPIMTYLVEQGISKTSIRTVKSTSDQVLIIINDK